ncbi:MAG: ATP-binding protein [Pseudomonadota bacterium]
MSPNEEFVATFLDELTDTLDAWLQLYNEVLAHDVDVPTAMKTMFRFAHNLKGASLSVELESFGGFIHKVEDFVTQIRDGQRPFNEIEQELLKEVLETLSEWKMNLSNNVNSDYYPKSLYDRIADQIARVAGEKPEMESDGFVLFDTLDEEKFLKNGPKETPNSPSTAQPIAPQSKATGTSDPAARTGSPTPGPSQQSLETIRVPRERVEEILALANEVNYVLASKGAAMSATSAPLKDLLVSVNPLNKELQESLFSLLLAPVDSLFAYLSKTAQDTAKKTGKQVEVFLDGTSERLDKVVLEKIKDPLMHIVRNSVDHGIENSELRLKTSKGAVGRLEISAHKTSAGLWVEIKDDGKGLDREKIRKKAVEKGLLSASAQLSEKECFDLLFLPGFSTAEKITDVSGRGVGLDVVRSTINALKGKVEIVSELGRGTSFRLFFQAKLALVETIQVIHQGANYAIATSQIREILLVKRSDFHSHPALGRTLNFNGTPVSVTDFGVAIGAKPNPSNAISEFCSVFIVESRGQIAGVAVDNLNEHQAVILEQLPSNLLDLAGVVGTTRLSDGMPAFVFDLVELKKELSWTEISWKGKAA